MLNDLRYALRMLIKSPGFTAVAIISLALGIGANVAVFSVFNSVIRGLPGVKAPERIAQLVQPESISDVEFEFLREHNHSFSAVTASGQAAMHFGSDDATGPGGAQQMLLLQIVAGDYFGTLGADPPLLGRYFVPAELDQAGGPPVAVLSHRFWLQQFEGKSSVIGQTIRLNGEDFVVIGVAPKSFTGREPSDRMMEPARNGHDDAPDAWSPLLAESGNIVLRRNAYLFRLFGRTREDVPVRQAQAELQLLLHDFDRVAATSPKGLLEARRVQLSAGFARIPREEMADPEVVLNLAVLQILLLVVLLVGCANVANLHLARAAERRREIGVRQALGASRGRLLRQLLTESLLLGSAGGIFALVLAHTVSRLIQIGAADALPEFRHYIDSLDFSIDLNVVLYTIGLSLASGFVFGLTPAFGLVRQNLLPAVKDDPRAHGRRSSGWSLRDLLIMTQVAVAMALAVPAGLLVRSVHLGTTREFGFASRDVLLVMPELPANFKPEQTAQFYAQLRPRLAALPGVQAIALTTIPRGGEPVSSLAVDGGNHHPFNPGFAGVNFYSPGYLQTMRIPLLYGRDFTDEDAQASATTAIISESLARKLGSEQSAIGRHIQLGNRAPALTVIGVTRDAIRPEVRDSAPSGRASYIYSAFAADIYLPLSRDLVLPPPNLVVRVSGDPANMAMALRREVRAMEPRADIAARTVRDLMNENLAPFAAISVSAFGLGMLATLLATIGIYGVMSYLVSSRTYEIGVRMSLGAGKMDLFKMVIIQGMSIVLVGVLVGGVGAVGLARLMASKLFGLSPLDPVSFGGVSLLFLLAALLACAVPARRATRVDPMVALRSE